MSPKVGAVLLAVTGVVVANSCSADVPVTVPDVVGLPEDQAVTALEDAGLYVDVETSGRNIDDPLLDAGDVMAQDPAAGGEVDSGSTVTVSVVPE